MFSYRQVSGESVIFPLKEPLLRREQPRSQGLLLPIPRLSRARSRGREGVDPGREVEERVPLLLKISWRSRGDDKGTNRR